MNKGYSYIELLIFFLISGICFNYLDFKSLAQVSLRQSSKDLSLLMQQTALETIASKQKKQLFYQKQTNIFFKINELENSIILKKIFALPQSIKIESFNFGNIRNKDYEISFYPSGSCSPGTITLGKGEQRCTIKQSLRGLITLICNN